MTDSQANNVSVCSCAYWEGGVRLTNPACPIHGEQPEAVTTNAGTVAENWRIERSRRANSSATISTSTKQRATSLGPQDIFLLDQWGRQLQEAFIETPYLVGSVARGETGWRDVDVRILNRLSTFGRMKPLGIRTVNLAISLWGRQVTGLPIDFQIQQSEEFHSYDGEIRNPLGSRSKAGWRLA